MCGVCCGVDNRSLSIVLTKFECQMLQYFGLKSLYELIDTLVKGLDTKTCMLLYKERTTDQS
jgi:hypothetical protein